MRRRRKLPVVGYTIDSDCEPEYQEYDASGSEASCSGRSLPCYVEHEPSGFQEEVSTLSNVALSLPFSSPGYNDAQRAREATTIPSQTLPMHIGETNNTSVQDSPSRIAQVFANVSGLYRELREADREGNTDGADKLLGQVYAEWCTTGGWVSYPLSACQRGTYLCRSGTVVIAHERRRRDNQVWTGCSPWPTRRAGAEVRVAKRDLRYHGARH